MSSLLPSLVDSIRGTAERELDSVAPGEPIVDVADVSVTLGSVQALDSVSLEVEQGEFLGVIGPNGAGKTTLLRTISGVLSPSGGTVTVDGQDITALPSKASSRLVAVVPQETSLAFDFTVREVVEMGRTPYRNRMTLESS
ncbi:MAG: ATP-binding cassette domain-containing protein, partial [Halobacteriota archaeon]